MERFILLSYQPPDQPSIEIIESKFLSEDDKYLYLESGRYRKKYVVAMSSRVEGDDDEDED